MAEPTGENPGDGRSCKWVYTSDRTGGHVAGRPQQKTISALPASGMVAIFWVARRSRYDVDEHLGYVIITLRANS
jgi:hypothetical protein